ncbi:hypothetical protein [Streptococcus iniae]|uniref:Uncharacterized protein n=5 Tax=Streptococcus iniae TaxID=1346 RepID=A0ABM5QGL2_STRIN|nr:hypothetical protein [Streptococcus iniae]AGM98296.1 hypothetical protein K710_0517 [Streptococcus iniae SF1]AHY15345.1 hypothetical protein DQ08_02470 [Streptococcus iniae]AHY17213.1 hypothetical protein DW64_02460 [Streptococcus iniae]AJG25522.1 hypothetical protein SI82_02705 [Streptococcus iniae]APD31390.1 hypothetical protein BMF34_02595 [Streptococcus iniae]
MKKLFRAFTKFSYYFPLLIMLIDIGYGLLKIDFGDSPDSAHSPYGWLFIFYLILPLFIFSLISYIGISLSSLKRLSQENTKYYKFFVVIQWVILNVTLIFCTSTPQIIFGSEALKSNYTTWIPLFLVFSLAISEMIHSKVKTFTKKVFVFPIIIFLLAIIPLTMQTISNHNIKANHFQQVKHFYQSVDDSYKVKDISTKSTFGLPFESQYGKYEISNYGKKLYSNTVFSNNKLERVHEKATLFCTTFIKCFSRQLIF